jgi:hypothetical protein
LRRNCLIKHIIEEKILGTRGRGRRRMQLLDDLKETRRYWKVKEEAQDRTLWRTQQSVWKRLLTSRETDKYLTWRGYGRV